MLAPANRPGNPEDLIEYTKKHENETISPVLPMNFTWLW